jgi:Asp-tRNA(Asn)/Glu-tRNA(Gln) amidotransferase A subunit family amidase
MPTGIHVVGGLFRDAEMLAVAQALQAATEFHRQRPRMDYGV